MKKSIRILNKTIRYCFGPIIVFTLILALDTALGIILTVLNKDMINALTDSIPLGTVSSLFTGLAAGYMILYFFQAGMGFLWTFGYNYFRLSIDGFFNRLFLIRSGETPQERFFDTAFMEKYSFVRDNTARISSYLRNLLTLVFSNIGAIAGTLGLFWLYEKKLAAVAVLAAILSGMVNGYIAGKEYALDKVQIKGQRERDYYREILTDKAYAKELRIYGIKENIFEKWRNIFDRLRTETLNLALKKATLQNIHSFLLFGLRIASIAILIWGVVNHKYSVGVFVMLFQLADNITYKIDATVESVMSGVYKDTKYLEDYYDFIMPVSRREIRTALLRKPSEKNEPAAESGNKAFTESESETILTARNLSYTYPGGERKAVDNVSFSVKKGEIVSIIGYNGSGKTTLSKLLSGALSPQTGSVTLNGIPLSQREPSQIYGFFGTAPQEFSRFSLSIRDFVGIGRIEKMEDEAELAKAYGKAGLEEFLKKYDTRDRTVLGKEYDDEGVELSGGEWQRLVIASAYMGEPEILIFDEPTASIDPLKEMDMIRHFRENLKGKTAVLVSHRIGFARLADRIVMMENGKITEEGTHEDLLKNNGSYAAVFREQKELYEGHLQFS